MPERSDNRSQLRRRVEEQVRRIQKAQRESHSLLAQTVYVGTLGLLFILPVVGGAYLGLWLDNLIEEYSARWTISMIFLGIVIGALNIYFYIRE